MILMVTLPQINPIMKSASVEAFYPSEGGLLLPGAKLLDVRIDLSLAVAHDCPPVSFHRIALRDRVWLRRMLVQPGDDVPVGGPLALLSTEPDENLDTPSQREARISIAGILHQSDWWNPGA